MILVSLDVRSSQFTKSNLSGGLNETTVRIGLDLGKKNLYENTLCINARTRIKFTITRNRVF